MTGWLATIGAAWAADVVVQDTVELEAALDTAEAGDVIHLGAGVWYLPKQIDAEVTLVGAGSTATTVMTRGRIESFAPLTFEDLELDTTASNLEAVLAHAFLTLRNVDVVLPKTAFDGISCLAGCLLEDVAFTGEGTQPGAVWAKGGPLTLRRVTLDGFASVAPVIDLYGAGALTLEDVTLTGVDSVYQLVHRLASGPSSLVRVRAACTTTDKPAVRLVGAVTMEAVAIDTAAGVAIEVEGDLDLRHGTIRSAGDVTVETTGDLALWSSVIGRSVDVGGTLSGGYDLFEVPPVPAGLVGSLTGDAALEGGPCELPVPSDGSPVVDAGDPAEVDRDGSRSDIGATGGPEGFPLDGTGTTVPGGTTPGGAVDLDRDGYPAGEDCDDADPGVHPGAEEDVGGADRDCDGWTDPAGPFLPRCAVGDAREGLLWLLALVAVRRRSVR
ncbi:MAG: putative metal-binding motif-containing protein [Myxococcota bacterium]